MAESIPTPIRPTAPMRPENPRRAPAYRGLAAPVRVLLWVAASVTVGMVIGVTFPAAMRELGAAAALAPGKLAWYGARVTGLLAYGAVAGSVVYGLLLSTRLLDSIAHRPITFALHKDLAIAGLALSGLHGMLLLADQTFAFTLAAIAIPFASPYAPAGVGIGQLAFYMVAIVTGSFYVRRQIGQRTWRLIHYLTFLSFLGVTLHGIAAGSDMTAPWALWIYLVPSAVVVFFVTYRLCAAMAVRYRRGQTPRADHPGAHLIARTAATPLPK